MKAVRVLTLPTTQSGSPRQGMEAHACDDPWAVSEEAYLRLSDREEQLRYLINYAVLAPSKLNTQPWLFSVGASHIHLFADRRRGLAVTDPEDRWLLMACGSALLNLTVAMKRFGMVPQVLTFPDINRPDLLATVRCSATAPPTTEVLRDFRAIQKRRTQTGNLETAPVPTAIAEELTLSPGSASVDLRVLTDSRILADLANIVLEAIRRQRRDPRVAREYASWTHPQRSRSRDGLPEKRRADGGQRRGARCQPASPEELLAPGPLLAVLTSRNDSNASRLESGSALQRVLLTAARHDLAACYLNHALEIPELHQQLDALLSPGRTVQTVLRVGHSPFIRPSPRRQIEDVILPAE